jgi:hypothetical protein
VGKPGARTDRRCGDLPGLDLAVVEETARRYDRCHPGDTFSNLLHRSSFSKEDRRLLEDRLPATLETVHDRSAHGHFKEKPDIADVARVWREAIQLAVRYP